MEQHDQEPVMDEQLNDQAPEVDELGSRPAAALRSADACARGLKQFYSV